MPEPLPRRPRSPAQIAAARVNGARSRGPRTPEGKARSSKNALAHGLAATVHLLAPGEDPAELQRLQAAFLAAHAPDRPSRALLLERLVAAAWKLRRAERLEAALHRLPPRAAPGRLDPDPGLPAALTRPNEYAILLRHQARLEGFLLRALRLLETAPAPEPTDPEDDPETPEPGPAPDGQEEPPARPSNAPAEGAVPDAPAGEAPAEDDEGADLADRPEPSAADPPEPVAGGAATPSDAHPGEGEPVEKADPGGDLHALARASAERLLRDGRPLEAARLARLLGPAGRARGTAHRPPEIVPDPPLDPAEAALFEQLGYESWVVPPGTGRRPLASLTAEWVCPADRWRVLEELRRVDDPAERARVLGHWARAGLDPGLDHPAYRGIAEPLRPGPAPAGPAEPPPEAAAPTGRKALLIRFGREAEAYHAVGRERRAREAWIRHARELGVPLPAHADPPEGLAVEWPPPAEPGPPGPAGPRPGGATPDPLATG